MEKQFHIGEPKVMSRKQRFQKKETNVVTFNNYIAKTRDVVITPRNRNQEKYLDLLENSKNYITIAIGDAGTGKTYLAMLAAIRALKENNIDKIILTRPAVGVDNEKHGFLPGNLDDKMQPWLIPLFDVLEEFYDPKQIKSMLDNKTIDISPLAFMRGRNLKRAYIIADEMQLSTITQFKMLLTRIAEGSKMIITGDINQSDRNLGDNAGLRDFMQRLKNYPGDMIGCVEFSRGDIQRHPIVNEVLNLYDQ